GAELPGTGGQAARRPAPRAADDGGQVIPRRTLAVAAAIASAGALAGSRAHAAGPPQITVQASADQVEAGEPLTIEMRAMVEQGDPPPWDPTLNVPRDLTLAGQSEGSQTFISMNGGRTVVQVGLHVTWQVVGQKPGRYIIPAPTVAWNG